ncbi:MAG: phosphoenolpyruvate--protein phosphotransferase [Desulfobacterales bacterium]|jgi:phosphotransferase system enzyme I (PtsP)
MKRKDHHHLHLLCDVSELTALLTGSEDIENFLQRTVEMIARHMDADVCSIYLYDEISGDLVLDATIGLNPAAIGKVRMKIGEGLVGTTLAKREPLNEGCARRHPRFKYFKEAGEDPFDSFLAVPILRGDEKIGVLVVQHKDRDYFGDADIRAMRGIASQIAGAVGNARLLIESNLQKKGEAHEYRAVESLRFIKGKMAAGGHAFAPAFVFEKGHVGLLDEHQDERYEKSEHSMADFHRAIQATAEQLKEYQERFARRLPESAALIFSAHLMILKDDRFMREMERRISEGIPPVAAIRAVTRHYIELFSSSGHAHIREKANDVQDLADRIMKNLEHQDEIDPTLRGDRIVIARELYPSDILRLASEDVRGIILVGGGVTSHVTILARSLQIPLMVTDEPQLLRLAEDTPVIMDAEIGSIYVKPDEEVVREYESEDKAPLAQGISFRDVSPETYSHDGVRIQLLANINILRDLKLARELKAEGIGLYRSEFPFLICSAVPSEEEQFFIYQRLFDEMPGKVITIRTLDIGGDKLLAYQDLKSEANPELGLRAIRFSLRHRDIFHQQLRAILRAAASTKTVQIMFPLISSLDEFQQARQAVYDCLLALERENLPHHQQPLIGVLVELPSIVEIIDELAAQADFLSIGTNDFVQYMLAVDRTNEKVVDYYQPYHPAVLRSLAKIVKAASIQNKRISVCGELAHDKDYIPFLLGIGVRILSVYPKFLPSVQNIISSIKTSEAKAYAQRLLSEATIQGVYRAMDELNKSYLAI